VYTRLLSACFGEAASSDSTKEDHRSWPSLSQFADAIEVYDIVMYFEICLICLIFATTPLRSALYRVYKF